MELNVLPSIAVNNNNIYRQNPVRARALSGQT